MSLTFIHIFSTYLLNSYYVMSKVLGTRNTVVVQSLCCVRVSELMNIACQASLSFIISLNLLKLMSTESVMSSNHLILCHPLLLPSILASIRVFSSDSALHIRWPKYWSFSFSVSPSNGYSGLKTNYYL